MTNHRRGTISRSHFYEKKIRRSKILQCKYQSDYVSLIVQNISLTRKETVALSVVLKKELFVPVKTKDFIFNNRINKDNTKSTMVSYC